MSDCSSPLTFKKYLKDLFTSFVFFERELTGWSKKSVMYNATK